MNTNLNDSAYSNYLLTRKLHWDSVARRFGVISGWGGYYHKRLQSIYQDIVGCADSILEIGCADGDLLASLTPGFGVGVDISSEFINRAKEKYPNLEFIVADGHFLPLERKFDIIILSDLLNDVWDVQFLFSQLQRISHPHTRIIVNNYSRLWELPFSLAEKLELKRPVLFQNWLTVESTRDLFHLAGFETIQSWPEVLIPFNIPLLEMVFNRFLVKIMPFQIFALTNFFVARPLKPDSRKTQASVSIIIPARNEAGNIPNIFKRVPKIGSTTELIFVEGNSTDDTFKEIKKAIEQNPDVNAKLFQQSGKGKGDAVRMGFSKASGDILMILDADLTVPPEYLPRFYDALVSGKGEFINGVRLIYPLEKEAMRFFNLLGNKLFSLAFSWLLGQPVNDTLCGTKVLWKKDYDRIARNRAYFGDFDPFGDFDLLFGAAKLKLKIVDLPIRYRERTYGTTNIDRWKHGLLLARMVLFAAGRIKFI